MQLITPGQAETNSAMQLAGKLDEKRRIAGAQARRDRMNAEYYEEADRTILTRHLEGSAE